MSMLAIRVGLVLLLAATPAMGQVLTQLKKPGGKSLLFPGLPMIAKGTPLSELQLGAKGTFWRDPEWIANLGLTADQQKKMDDIFREHRLKLIDLSASLQKNELLMAPMIDALPNADPSRILAHIDRVAEDRAELEKANSRMLLGLLQALTPDQWIKLREKRK